jgi:uncharacterized membrane protein
MTIPSSDTLPNTPIILDGEHKSLLQKLRIKKPAHQKIYSPNKDLGARVSDAVASTVGSWPFIIIQSTLLFLWICANILGWVKAWDPYPFILLNLALSFQAAYTAPIIMMSQNRESQLDRAKAEKDYDVNLKSELEIELLHQKMDMMREQEIKRLTVLVEELTEAVLKLKRTEEK